MQQHSVQRRKPLVALAMSFVLPGFGQLYNGDPWRGLAFAVAGALTAFGPWNPLEVEIDLDDPVSCANVFFPDEPLEEIRRRLAAVQATALRRGRRPAGQRAPN